MSDYQLFRGFINKNLRIATEPQGRGGVCAGLQRNRASSVAHAVERNVTRVCCAIKQRITSVRLAVSINIPCFINAN